MDWFRVLETFINVSETNSFTQAAQKQGVSKSIITSRIQWLENRLSSALFHRSAREVHLTKQGELFLTKIQPLVNNWQAIYLETKEASSTPTGSITLGVLPFFAEGELYIQLYKSFLEHYPGIQLHIIPIHNPINLIQEKIDLLLGYDRYVVNQSNTIRHKLLDCTFGCYASNAYLAQHSAPEAIQDLLSHNCIIYRKETVWTLNSEKITVSGNFHSEQPQGLLQACLQGIGIIYFPDYIVGPSHNASIIQKVLPNCSGKTEAISIFYPKSDYYPKKLMVLINFLKTHFYSVTVTAN